MLNVVFALLGLFVGGIINVLADDLPGRRGAQTPHCPNCDYSYGPAGWLAVTRRISGSSCPVCGQAHRRRPLLVEVGATLLFAALPSLITPVTDLAIYSAYIAILILIIVIDVEHRLVLHVVTIPSTLFALAASFLLTDSGPRLAVVGAVAGFAFFYLAYLVGQRLFGPGALGFGDVTLATTMGMMLGFDRIFFALILGVLFAGLWSLVGLLSGRMNRRAYFAYGPFLALAGIVTIIWGDSFYAWFTNS